MSRCLFLSIYNAFCPLGRHYICIINRQVLLKWPSFLKNIKCLMPPGDVLHPAKIIIPLSFLFVFPQQLFNCQALKKLSMPDNDLSNLPTTIASLVNLKELDISKNGIQPKQPWFKITGRSLIIAIPKLHNEEEETKPGGADFCETKHHV